MLLSLCINGIYVYSFIHFLYPRVCLPCVLMYTTYRHCAAPVQAVDGSLGFGVSLEFYKSAPCNQTESVTAHRLMKQGSLRVVMSVCTVGVLPLLVPSGPLNTVHSSMLPKGSNSLLTSSSLCCFPSMPTNNFLSSVRPRTCTRKKKRYEINFSHISSC